MNYLAHIYLSSSPQEQVGNFIGDFVKGRQHENYPPEIQRGILQHRAIDAFTDQHPLVREAKAWLRTPFGRYAGIVLDLYFDYFLAIRFQHYAGMPLHVFVRRFYWTLWRQRRVLPRQVRGFMWHFILSNRLGRYATLQGLQESFSIMSRYKAFPVVPEQAISFLQENHHQLETYFLQFFDEVKTINNCF